MIDLWVSTMNRACQLQLLLESLEKNIPNVFNYFVSYRYSNNDYLDGYKKLMNSNLGNKCKWIEQVPFGIKIYNFFNNHRSDIFCHFVDDAIFYRKANFSETEIREIFKDESIWGFDLRLGKNTTIKDHRQRKFVGLPDSLQEVNEKFLKWEYKEYPEIWINNWAFPCSIDGMIYRVNDLLENLSYTNIETFDDPAQIEGGLCHSPLKKRPQGVCPLYSCSFSNHINSVHNRGYDNSANQFNMGHNDLNSKYLEGWKIDINSLDYNKVECGHEQLPFLMIRNEE